MGFAEAAQADFVWHHRWHRLHASPDTTEPRQPCDWLPGLLFDPVGL